MLRGGIVGMGRMGLTHFSILNNHPDVKWAAVCDSSNFVLKTLGHHLGVETFTDFEKMLATMNLDFVVVATPTAMHAEVAECAIANDAHVFVEKPLALNPEQSGRLADLARGKSLVHQVGYAMRFHEIFMKTKSLLDRGAIGSVVTFTVEMNGPVVLHDARKSWRSKKTEGGGCLYDFASHSVDLVNYLIGPPDQVVGTVFSHIHSDDVEDAISSTFVYDNGTRGTLLANWSDPSYRKPSCRFEALGTQGKIIADFYTYKVFLQGTPQIDEYSEGWNEGYLADIAEPVRFYVRGFQFTRQLDYFIDCIRSQKACERCSFEEGLSTDVIMHQIRTDGETRRFHDRQNHIGRQPVLRH
jgi:predicted dehydrogenase